MIKNIFFTIIFCLFANTFLKAQLGLSSPVLHAHWKFSTKKITDCEYDLIFTVTLDKGWHTFSVQKIKGAELEVFATQIIFTPNNNYSLIGNLTETKPTPEYDKTIEKTVLLHYNQVIFTQRVKLNSNSTIKISGKYEYQVCKEACEKPPYEEFTFEMKGTPACKK
jgi:thiol:disulfide interchange protein DsbD